MKMSNITVHRNESIATELRSQLVSKETLKMVIIIVTFIIIPVFCLLGTIGNTLSIRVLANKRMRNQINYVLLNLCISDTLFLIHCLLYTFINVYRQMRPLEGEAFRSRVYPFVGAYGSVITARFTSCLTTLLSVQRFIAVFYPMKAKTICTKRNTLVAILIIYFFTSLLFIPFIFKYESVEVVLRNNITSRILNITDFYKHHVKLYSVYGTILNVLFRFAPLVVIFVLNTVMIRVVHRTWKERRSMSIQENSSPSVFRSRSKNGGSRPVGYNDQQKITIMLVTVSMVFLIFIIPGALNSIATHVFRSYSPVGENKNLYMLISTIAFLLETINSSVNFIIYMAMSKRFRLMNKETLCCGNGEYYRKISFSSVKEQFRWSSSKKHNRYQEHPLFDRRTVSDIGPLLNVSNGNAGGRRWSEEAHSEGWKLRSHERGSGIGHKIPETISEEPSPPQSKHCLQILQTKTLKKLLVSKRKKKTMTSLLPDRHLNECNGNCSNGDSVEIM